MGEAAEVRELDHPRLLVGQRLEHPPDRGSLLAAGGLDLGSLARLEALLDALVAGPPALLDDGAAKRGDRPVVDDAEHPGPHAAARPVVTAARAPDREERFLGDVLGQRPRAAHAVGERERGAAVALVDALERARLALGHEGHELLVGERLQRALERMVSLATFEGHGASGSFAVEASADQSRRRSFRASSVTSRAVRSANPRTPWDLLRCARWRTRRSTSAAPAAVPTATAAAGRAQLRGSRIAESSHDSSSSAASSVSSTSADSSRRDSSSGGSTGTSARRSSCSKSIASPGMGSAIMRGPPAS